MSIFAATSGELGFFPGFDLFAHGVGVPLHFVHSNGDGILQGEVFGMLGENRLELTVDGHRVTKSNVLSGLIRDLKTRCEQLSVDKSA